MGGFYANLCSFYYSTFKAALQLFFPSFGIYGAGLSALVFPFNLIAEGIKLYYNKGYGTSRRSG